MTDEFIGNTTIQSVYGLDVAKTFEQQFSPLSIESLLFFVVASAIFVVETLMDGLRTDVNTALSLRLTHNRQWYINIAKAFQYGDALVGDTDKYAVTDPLKQVVSYAAVDEQDGTLILKVATLSGEALSGLTSQQLIAFTSYMSKVKDGGVKINIISSAGDDLRLTVKIDYDPMVLDANGKLLSDPSTEPAKETMLTHIRNLPFNGEFTPMALVDALQVTEGIVIPTIESAESKYALNDWATIDAKFKPVAGYCVLQDANLTITYRAYDAD